MPIYEFRRPWPVHSVAFRTNRSDRQNDCLLAALGSSMPGLENKVDIVSLPTSSMQHSPTSKEVIHQLDPIVSFDHAYPVTKILWSPNGRDQNKLASTGHDLRLWDFEPSGYTVQSGWRKRSHDGEQKTPQAQAPIAAITGPGAEPGRGALVSFDWAYSASNSIAVCGLADRSLGHDDQVANLSIWDLTDQPVKDFELRIDRWNGQSTIGNPIDFLDVGFQPTSDAQIVAASWCQNDTGSSGMMLADRRQKFHVLSAHDEPTSGAAEVPLDNALRLWWNPTNDKQLAVQRGGEVLVADLRCMSSAPGARIQDCDITDCGLIVSNKLTETCGAAWFPKKVVGQDGQPESRLLSISAHPGSNPYLWKVSGSVGGPTWLAEDNYLSLGQSTDSDTRPHNVQWCQSGELDDNERFVGLVFSHKLQVLDLGKLLE